MTVREFIKFLNPEKVLNGEISFKIVCNGDKDNKYGDKWFFHHDKNEAPEEDTVEKFCNNPVIAGCMDKVIDPCSIECNIECDPDSIEYWMIAYKPDWEQE